MNSDELLKHVSSCLSRMPEHLPIPQVPQDLAQLDRAIELLGERAKGLELRESKQGELVLLLHAYPNVPTAAAWKSELKRLRAQIHIHDLEQPAAGP